MRSHSFSSTVFVIAASLVVVGPLRSQVPAATLQSAPATPGPVPAQSPAPPGAGATVVEEPAEEMPKNLEVLPRDWTRRQVVDQVMKRFTADLGVRCQHCHVGAENVPLTEWDFASDEKPTKRRAREMYLMLAEINRRLAAMPSFAGQTEPLSATCFTCHRGMPRPRRIEDVFEETRAGKGLAAAIAEYRDLRAKNLVGGGYDFRVQPLVRLARARLDDGDAAEARQVLALAVELGFDTLSTRVTMAQVELAAGDRAAAVEHLGLALAKAQNAAEREFVEEELRKAHGTPEEP